MKPYIFLLFSMIVTLLNSQSNLKVQFNHNAGGNTVEINKTVFNLTNGKAVMLTRAEFYLSGIKAYNSVSSDSFSFANSYLLVNAERPKEEHEIGELPSGFDFRVLRWDVGVDKDKNHADPSLYSPTHPLGLQIPSMHWGWAAGYRFMALEGKIDGNNDGVPEQDFQFHNLGDDLLFRAMLDMNGSHHVESEPLIVDLDYVKLFDNIAMTGNIVLHGSGAKNKTMMQNSAKNGFFTPQIVSSVNDEKEVPEFTISQDAFQITIAMPINDNYQVLVYDVRGSLISNKSINDSSYTIDKTNLAPANYLVTIVNSKGVKATKQIFIR